MEKTIFIWGILCVLSTILFSSCNKEDEEIDNGHPESVTQKQKHLVSLTCHESGKTENTTYKYDATGKMIKKSFSDGKEHYCFNFSDTVTIGGHEQIVFYKTKFNPDGSIVIDSTISKHITTSKYVPDNTIPYTSTRIFNYDENGHLVDCESYVSDKEGEKDTYEWTWVDGNITNFKSSLIDLVNYSYEINWQYKYTNEEVTTPIVNKTDVLFSCYCNDHMIDNSNRYGIPCKNLPVSIFNEKRGSEQRIKWSLDSDGYPIKAERYYFTDGKPSKIISTQEFIWE
jgi:YD repeat-containing protein